MKKNKKHIKFFKKRKKEKEKEKKKIKEKKEGEEKKKAAYQCNQHSTCVNKLLRKLRCSQNKLCTRPC
jgi:hypothetical protein